MVESRTLGSHLFRRVWMAHRTVTLSSGAFRRPDGPPGPPKKELQVTIRTGRSADTGAGRKSLLHPGPGGLGRR